MPKEIYSNWTAKAPNGKLMFRCSENRAKWYVKKNLATKIKEKTIQLNFEPKGLGKNGVEFYEQTRKNECTVCGIKENLEKHHVVPYCFRRFMPTEIKSKSSHDILPMCRKCHRKYETMAMQRKLEIVDDHGPELMKEARLNDKLRKLANALLCYRDMMPEDRIREIKERIKEISGETKISTELLERIKKENNNDGEGEVWKQVTEKIEDLSKFSEEWRTHFLETIDPQFMPDGWRIDFQDKT